MKRLKRLDIDAGASVYERARRAPLRHFALEERECLEIERDAPERIVAQEGALLVAQAHPHLVELHYAFAGRDAFRRLFPSMLERILRAVEPEQAPLGLRLRLVDRADRPYVEPVLFAQAFEAVREWVEMRLAPLPESPAPSDEIAAGYLLRPARGGDAQAVAELGAEAFPTSWLTPEAAQPKLPEATALRILEDTAARTPAGFLHVSVERGSVGHVVDIAIRPDYQRRGLGEAMMRWAIGWCAARGLREVTLTVNANNAPALALYRKLGFAAGQIGLDYRRPLDEDEVRQVLERNRAAHIRVRVRS
jgi:ribosomal protein S18 acetylase RimI-like enzyme